MSSINVSAAVARAPQAPLSIESLELDEPRADELLVRLVATGVCHTDIAMRDQTHPVPQPIVLGHEGAGPFIPELLDLHRQGRFPFDRLLQFYRFDQINEAIADTEAGRAVKPVLLFGDAQ